MDSGCVNVEDACFVSNVCSNSAGLVQQCTCSAIAYFLAAACHTCSGQGTSPSWAMYAQQSSCNGAPEEFPPEPGSTGIPSWVLVMASATPIPTNFNLTAAAALAATQQSNSVTSSPSTTSQSPTAAGPSGVSIAPTGSPQPSSTHRKKVPTAAIIGVVLAVCLIISLAIFLCGRRRRRYASTARGVSPFAVHTTHIQMKNDPTNDSDSQSVSTVRRWYLQNELRAAQEKIANIQQVERNPHQPGESGAGQRSSDPGVVAQLRELTARMRELEVQMQSTQMLGLSDESPPGYMDAES
ncbi:hypothetical protein K438DRAFT_1797894 [Mycena galopus ATCC 62051]|nr:hypothetical protein K438DRAFT_1797894 [Mycena galopus ATCC 62051]